MTDPAADFGLFVSSVDGCPVARFGTKVLIGAMRLGSSITYNTKAIIPIPKAEARRYGREYARAIDNGSLRKRSAKAWREQQAKIQTKKRASAKLAAPKEEVGAPLVDTPTGERKDDPSESGSE